MFTKEVSKPATLSIGLYHDGEVSGNTTDGDNLSDSDDIGSITTEPDDGQYGPQTVSFDASGFSVAQNANGEWYAATDSGVMFSVENTTGTVDAYYVAVEYDRDGDGTPEPHLYWTGPLDGIYDLGDNVSIELGNVGFAQT